MSSLGLMLVEPFAAAVTEVARVLKPGGMFALLPAMWPLHSRDLLPVLALSVLLRGPGKMPQRVSRRRATSCLSQAGFDVLDESHVRRFPFPLRTVEDAQLAVEALYTPGRTPDQLAATAKMWRLSSNDRKSPISRSSSKTWRHISCPSVP